MLEKLFEIFIKRNIKPIGQDIIYKVGMYSILLPSDHRLPEYQSTYKNYDKKLKQIIQSTNIKNKIIIDIGANVGDTAAYMRSFSNSHIYCIEGDRVYLEYLKKNTRSLPHITIIESFVQGRKNLDKIKVVRTNGTAKLKPNLEDTNINSIKTTTIADLLDEYNIDPQAIQLIKIDTDGFDFDILLANKYLIKEHKPEIFFEYDVNINSTDETDSIELIALLESLEYKFIVYDNFGNLLEVIVKDAIKKFIELNHFLKSSRENGGGIYYFDIFTSTNSNLIQSIEENDNIF